MQTLALVCLVILGASVAEAQDLGNQWQPGQKQTTSVALPGTPDGREGGETIEDAFLIPALPYSDTGNTSDNTSEYDAMCPWGGGYSPDVVYSFLPDQDMAISVDLCGSSYDTKTYIFDEEMNLVECNDDFYFDPDDPCGQYVSKIEYAEVVGGAVHFIVVDGYGNSGGDYLIEVVEVPFSWVDPCILECEGGVLEGEPELMDGYVDQYNSGCSDEANLDPFQHLAGTGGEELLFCGTSGWFQPYFRDTDWFTAVIGSAGVLRWSLDAEQETYGFLLGPQDCDQVAALEIMEAGPCQEAELTITGEPGDLVWLWVGPTSYYPPEDFTGHEYRYLSSFEGIADGTVATDSRSWDRVKSLYR